MQRDDRSIIVFGDSDDDGMGVRGDTVEEMYANAKLIAAAPALLEALDYLLKWPNSELAHNIAKSAIKRATA